MSRPTKPIRIAFCITDLDPGGAERALVQIATRLDRECWDPAVYCLSGPGELVSVLEQAGIPVTCFGACGVRDLGVVRRLAKEFRTFSPQVLQTFLFHANLLGRLAGYWASVPHIVSGIRVAEKRTRMHLVLDRITNRLVDVNVCVSEAVAEFSIERGGLNRGKTIVIPNGVDFARFSTAQPADLAEFGIPAESRVVVAVGRLDPQKGLTYLLEGMRSVVLHDDKRHLLLVGDGPQRDELIAMAKRLGIAEHVHFAGRRSDVPEILQACDCLVLASLWEGMANVVLEGMAAGIPVVATRVEGTAEQISDGVDGVLVTAASAEELAQGLETLFCNPARAADFVEKAQAKVSEHFTWDKVVAAYARLYHDIVNRA